MSFEDIKLSEVRYEHDFRSYTFSSGENFYTFRDENGDGRVNGENELVTSDYTVDAYENISLRTFIESRVDAFNRNLSSEIESVGRRLVGTSLEEDYDYNCSFASLIPHKRSSEDAIAVDLDGNETVDTLRFMTSNGVNVEITAASWDDDACLVVDPLRVGVEILGELDQLFDGTL